MIQSIDSCSSTNIANSLPQSKCSSFPSSCWHLPPCPLLFRPRILSLGLVIWVHSPLLRHALQRAALTSVVDVLCTRSLAAGIGALALKSQAGLDKLAGGITGTPQIIVYVCFKTSAGGR